MKFKVLITACMLMLALPATAQFTTTVLAHEVALSQLRLPAHPNGTIAFKACQECDYQTVRVTESTRYVLNGKSTSLEKFRLAAAGVRERSLQAVAVHQHLADNVVTSVKMTVQ